MENEYRKSPFFGRSLELPAEIQVFRQNRIAGIGSPYNFLALVIYNQGRNSVVKYFQNIVCGLKLHHRPQNLTFRIQFHRSLLRGLQHLCSRRQHSSYQHRGNGGENNDISVRLSHVLSSSFYSLLLHNGRSTAQTRSSTRSPT